MNSKKLKGIVKNFIREHGLEEAREIRFKIIRNGRPIVGYYGDCFLYTNYEEENFYSSVLGIGDLPIDQHYWKQGDARFIERAFQLKNVIVEKYCNDTKRDNVMAVVTLTDCPLLSNGMVFIPSLQCVYTTKDDHWHNKTQTKRLLRALPKRKEHYVSGYSCMTEEEKKNRIAIPYAVFVALNNIVVAYGVNDKNSSKHRDGSSNSFDHLFNTYAEATAFVQEMENRGLRNTVTGVEIITEWDNFRAGKEIIYTDF